jgi:CRP-like cAMP-binding protein
MSSSSSVGRLHPPRALNLPRAVGEVFISADKLLSPSNQLIDSLPRADRDRVLSRASTVTLELSKVICEQGARMRHVYFPIDSFISLLTMVDENSTLEVGMVGSEGVCGHTVLLGSEVAPLRALTQGAGKAWRLATPVFRDLTTTIPALRDVVGRYAFVSLGQLARTSACTRFHVVERRLARWLLMTSDRAHSDTFIVTQEFLAYMLGVRRVGVSDAANVLKSRRLIDYRRGSVSILDRAGLEAASCSCYAADLGIHRRWLPPRAKYA